MISHHFANIGVLIFNLVKDNTGNYISEHNKTLDIGNLYEVLYC